MSALPPVQQEYAHLEDALTVWGERNPRSPHRRYELAAVEAARLAGEIAAAFTRCAEDVEFELGEYRERAR